MRRREGMATMADKSKIEWTDSTWNPITGCTPVSEGCASCYAKREAEGRLRGKYGYPQDEPFRVTFHEDKLEQPLKWRRPRKIFVCSMGDLFHEAVTNEMLDDVFDVMALASHHTFLILTKRPERMKEYLFLLPDRIGYGDAFCEAVREADQDDPDDLSGAVMNQWVKKVLSVEAGIANIAKLEQGVPLPNVWLGVTAENQQRADERIPLLLQIPAAKHFVSVEPMLGPVNFEDVPVGMLGPLRPVRKGLPEDIPRLDWVICGGETGANARPMHPDWVRSLRDQCQGAQVPFFFKSWGEFVEEDNSPLDAVLPASCTLFWQTDANDGPCLYRVGRKRAGRMIDGRTWDEEPA